MVVDKDGRSEFSGEISVNKSEAIILLAMINAHLPLDFNYNGLALSDSGVSLGPIPREVSLLLQEYEHEVNRNNAEIQNDINYHTDDLESDDESINPRYSW